MGIESETRSGQRTSKTKKKMSDAWPGKYSQLDEALAMLKPGGLYVIDDMLPQPNWPEGHAAKAEALIELLENRTDFNLTKMNWSTGVILMAKK
jgi:hypothetical protein